MVPINPLLSSEAEVAVLSTRVDAIQEDVSEIKRDVKELSATSNSLDKKIDGLGKYAAGAGAAGGILVAIFGKLIVPAFMSAFR